ncbi:MAG: response regulator transcription factor [candidate division WOR-3 bacterium]
MKTVFVLEDEPDINRLVREALEAAGFRTRGFFRADELLFAMQGKIPDLLVIDLMLPDGDGMDLARQLKSTERTSNIPIVILTARTSEADTVLGFEIGADDYIKKPFSPREMVARVKRLLRAKEVPGPGELRHGPLRILPEANKAYVNKTLLRLSPSEFVILLELVKAGGRTVRRTALLSAIGSLGGPRTVDVHIRTLRKKLGKSGRLIETVRGVGYRLTEGT